MQENELNVAQKLHVPWKAAGFVIGLRGRSIKMIEKTAGIKITSETVDYPDATLSQKIRIFNILSPLTMTSSDPLPTSVKLAGDAILAAVATYLDLVNSGGAEVLASYHHKIVVKSEDGSLTVTSVHVYRPPPRLDAPQAVRLRSSKNRAAAKRARSSSGTSSPRPPAPALRVPVYKQEAPVRVKVVSCSPTGVVVFEVPHRKLGFVYLTEAQFWDTYSVTEEYAKDLREMLEAERARLEAKAHQAEA